MKKLLLALLLSTNIFAIDIMNSTSEEFTECRDKCMLMLIGAYNGIEKSQLVVHIYLKTFDDHVTAIRIARELYKINIFDAWRLKDIEKFFA